MIGQPVIQVSWSPEIGDQWKQSITNEIPDVSATGANQFWDFSDVTLVPGESLIFDFVDKSTGINPACYPEATIGANLTIEGADSGFAFGYYEQDQSSFKAWGESTIFDSKTVYSDPQEFEYIGLQFGQSTSDEYKGMTTSGTLQATLGGFTTYTYDAYGTVNLPQGSIDDVIRINQVDASQDTFAVGGLITISVDTLYSIGFMADGSVFPIAIWQRNVTYDKSYLNGVLVDSTFENEVVTFSINPDYDANSAIYPNQLLSDIKIYPTIAHEFITIKSEMDAELLIVTNMMGMVVDKILLDIPEKQMSILGLLPGTYFLSDRQGRFIGKFTKAQ